MMSPDAFTQEQQYREFAQQYIIDFNATAAYRRCNWTKKARRDQQIESSNELLGNLQVQEYVRQLMEERRKRLDISTDAVAKEWARVGFSDITNYYEYTSNGVKLKDSGLLDEDASRAIESVEIVERELISGVKVKKTKVRLHNKVSALESLAKHLGMYTEKHQIDITVDKREQVRSDLMDVLRQTGDRLRQRGYTGNGSNGLTE